MKLQPRLVSLSPRVSSYWVVQLLSKSRKVPILSAMAPAFFRVALQEHMGRILRHMCATTVQLGGPLTKALSHVHHVIKVRLQILMDQDANHVPTDSSSRGRGVHSASNVHWGTRSRTLARVPARASTGSIQKTARANSF